MKKQKSIRQRLTMAMCALAANPAMAAEGDRAVENDWVIDSSVLRYAEDERVEVTKALLTVDGNVSNTDNVKVDIVFDSLTGATPTGAINTPGSAVTFTSTSGAAGGSASNGGAIELAEFDDTRLAVGLDWEHTSSRRLKQSFGGNLSVENDWRSFGASWAISLDSKNKRNTYTAGIAYTNDEIFRVGGGTPEGLTPTAAGSFLDDGSRNTFDLLAGVSRALNRRTVGQFTVSAGFSDGYHTDPYKVVSQIDPVLNIEIDRFYEQRPEERMRYTVFGRLVHRLANDRDTVNISYRFYDDDWEITSHTVDLRYRRDIGDKGKFLEPHVRLYHQSAAFFYANSLAPGALPQFVSADSRLDEFVGVTLGLKYGMPVGNKGKFRIRAEYIDQSFEESQFDELTATLFQISYEKAF